MLLTLCWLIGLIAVTLDAAAGHLQWRDFLWGVLWGLGLMGTLANALMTEAERQRPLSILWPRRSP